MVAEPITATLSILASVLSIAASVRKLMEMRRIGREQALEAYREEATPAERALLEKPDIEEAVLEITVISEKLLDQLAREAKKCEDEHVNDRKRAKTITEREQADIDAGQCMCKVLRDIKRYNKKKLPQAQDFLDWWESYSCKD